MQAVKAGQNHPYARVNLERDTSEILYEDVDIKWGEMDDYVVHRKGGRGRYSHVLEGTNAKDGKRVAIKVLLPIRKEKIKRQYHILSSLSHPNIISVREMLKCPHQRTTSIVMEYFPHTDFRELYPKLTPPQIKLYLKQLFTALDYLHSQGIMHRDIKPFNVLINPETERLKLIDFGLSDYFIPEKESNEHVASLYYKAPELMFGDTRYDYRVDVWAAGMIMAGMIFEKTPFVMGNDSIDQILKISKLLGIQEVVNFIKKNKLSEKKGHRKENICFDILVAFQNGDIVSEGPADLSTYVTASNEEKCTEEALDLLQNLLILDWTERYTAKQALQHPFFD